MSITILAMLAANNIIGYNDTIPWRISKELHNFRKQTEGGAIIIGRKTYEALPDEFKPLPKRLNIVLTRDKQCSGCAKKGYIYAYDLKSAVMLARSLRAKDEIYIIGGASVFEQAIALPFIKNMRLAILKQSYNGNKQFPFIDYDWSLARKTEHDEFDVMDYER